MSKAKTLIKFFHQTNRKNAGKILKEGFKLHRYVRSPIAGIPWGLFGKDNPRLINGFGKNPANIQVIKKGFLKKFYGLEYAVNFLNRVDDTIKPTIQRAEKSKSHWFKKFDKVFENKKMNPDKKELLLQKIINKAQSRNIKISGEAHTKMRRAMKRAKIDAIEYPETNPNMSNYGNKTIIARSAKGAKAELLHKNYTVRFVKIRGRIVPIKKYNK